MVVLFTLFAMIFLMYFNGHPATRKMRYAHLNPLAYLLFGDFKWSWHIFSQPFKVCLSPFSSLLLPPFPPPLCLPSTLTQSPFIIRHPTMHTPCASW